MVLGTLLSAGNRPREAVAHRLVKAWSSWRTNRELFVVFRHAPAVQRMALFASVVGGTALWGSEAVPLCRADVQHLGATCLTMRRSILPSGRRPGEGGYSMA